MTLKWSEGEPRSNNIVDAGQINKAYDSYKGAFNGALNRDNIPANSISAQHTKDGAFHQCTLVTPITMDQGTDPWENAGDELGPNGWKPSSYQGGWYKAHSSSLNVKEGMLHVELMGYCCYNMVNTMRSTSEQRGSTYGGEFRIHVNGVEVVRSPLYTYIIHPVHVVADIPIAGGNKTVEVFWRQDVTPPQQGMDTWTFYFAGMQLFIMNRFR